MLHLRTEKRPLYEVLVQSHLIEFVRPISYTESDSWSNTSSNEQAAIVADYDNYAIEQDFLEYGAVPDDLGGISFEDAQTLFRERYA